MAKYNVGDRVTIRRDLKHNTRYDGLFCNSDMIRYRGKQMTIIEVFPRGIDDRDDYKLVEDYRRWIWTNSMFEDTELCEPVSIDIDDIL